MTELRPTLERAMAHLRGGDSASARREAEAALAAAPDDVRLLHFLGSLCCHSGALDEGVGFLERALARDAAHAGARLNLARALSALGRVDEALAVCASAPAAHVELRRVEGQLLQQQGRQAEAIAHYEHVVAARPGDVEIWNNLGNARRVTGDVDGAIAALQRAAALRPDLLPIQANLAAALAAAGRLEPALAAFRTALRIAPDEPALRLEAARLLHHLGRFDESLACVGDGDTVEFLVAKARTLTGLHRLDEAEQAYRAALRGGAERSELWLELGIVLERAGKAADLPPLLEEAERNSIADDSLAYLHAILLDREGRTAEALAAAKRARADLEPARTQRLIARLADRTGEPGLAFAAAEEANRLAAEQYPDAAERAAAYRARVAAMTRTVTSSWYARWSPPVPPPTRPAPAFLVGFPRSGTTLLDTMLMGHSGTHVLEEIALLDSVLARVGELERLADLDEDEIAGLRDFYFSALDEASSPPRGRLVIDKLPLNILAAPLIHRLFPDARFILSLRHPCDVALSCFMQGFELNDAMANFLSLEDTAALYDLVLTHWQRCRDVLPLQVHRLRYEQLVADPGAAMRPLIDFLGLDWRPETLDHRKTAAARGQISTPSYNQVTQNLYGHASGRWQRYRDQLAPVLPILLGWAGRLGYEDS